MIYSLKVLIEVISAYPPWLKAVDVILTLLVILVIILAVISNR